MISTYQPLRLPQMEGDQLDYAKWPQLCEVLMVTTQLEGAPGNLYVSDIMATPRQLNGAW